MRIRWILPILIFTTLACSFLGPSPASPAVPPSPTFTPIPSLTPSPVAPTNPPPTQAGKVTLDFAILMCNARWMNGVQYVPCPATENSRPAGYASLMDPTTQGLPPNTPVLLTVPAQNGASSIFGRYPTYQVQPGDRFQATLRCVTDQPCNVEFALEYYDAQGKYHDHFGAWRYVGGTSPIPADLDLSPLAGQQVNFTLAVRPLGSSTQNDLALWIAPRIYQPQP